MKQKSGGGEEEEYEVVDDDHDDDDDDEFTKCFEFQHLPDGIHKKNVPISFLRVQKLSSNDFKLLGQLINSTFQTISNNSDKLCQACNINILGLFTDNDEVIKRLPYFSELQNDSFRRSRNPNIRPWVEESAYSIK